MRQELMLALEKGRVKGLMLRGRLRRFERGQIAVQVGFRRQTGRLGGIFNASRAGLNAFKLGAACSSVVLIKRMTKGERKNTYI